MNINLNFCVYQTTLYSHKMLIIIIQKMNIPNNQNLIKQNEEQKLVKKIKNYIYDPSDLIGSGFSSNVYKGLNQYTNETIAVKVLQLSKIQNEVEKYLLNNQINALRALNHKNILRTIQILMTKNNVYIMTEFCENGDLQQHIKKKGKLTDWEALHFIRDIAEGYQAIEQKKIVHRDIKSANIFLTPTGARIADFGFCQFLNQTKRPQINYNVGSPAYMSPESYKQNIYSAKSDIWSIGIIFYEMLLGQTPDKNLTYTQMVTNLMNGRINCATSEEIKKILARCFKKQLKQRISVLHLIDSVNLQISRIDPSKMRPQTVHLGLVQPPNSFANQSNLNKFTKPIGQPYHPLSPSDVQFQVRNSHNKQMAASMLPNSQQQNIRSQSPFQARFGFREQANKIFDSSPRKVMDQRFSGKQFKDNQQKLVYHHEPSQQIHVPINRFKSHIQMLLFLFRLLNYISQANLQKIQYIKLVLFRQRSFLENLIQKIIFEQKIDKNLCEGYKEFHFLKSRFDETYLLRESTVKNNMTSGTQIMKQLNEYANSHFLDTKAITTYCLVILDAMAECQFFLRGNNSEQQSNRIGVLLDYIMIELEILDLYSQGVTNQILTQEIIILEHIMKEQPKKLSPSHYQLLIMKCKMLQQLFSHIGNNLILNNQVIDHIEERRISNDPWHEIDRKPIISINPFA